MKLYKRWRKKLKIIGIILLIHNFVTGKWYSHLFKGRYNCQRTVNVLVNLALFICFIGVMISGLMMSQYIFRFLNLKTTMFARKMHMLFAAWCLILISIHIGLHWSLISMKIKKLFSKKQTYKHLLTIFYTFCILLYILSKTTME